MQWFSGMYHSHDSFHGFPLRDILGLADWLGEETSPVESAGRRNNDHED